MQHHPPRLRTARGPSHATAHRLAGKQVPAGHASRLRSNCAMSLFEVMFAALILTMVVFGVLQGMIQSRRMTEGSVRQASVASLVQGYLEQLKSVKYGDLPASPTATPGSGTESDWVAAGNVVVVKDSNQTNSIICLVPGAAPTSLPDISTLATDASLHTETVDIDSSAVNSTLRMWVWINDLTGTNVVSCKSIVVVYQWTVRDGGRIRVYNDMVRTIRSIVPTD